MVKKRNNVFVCVLLDIFSKFDWLLVSLYRIFGNTPWICCIEYLKRFTGAHFLYMIRLKY